MRASRASPDSPSSWPWPTRMRGVWAGSRFFTRSARGSVDGWRVVSGEATIVAMTTPLRSVIWLYAWSRSTWTLLGQLRAHSGPSQRHPGSKLS